MRKTGVCLIPAMFVVAFFTFTTAPASALDLGDGHKLYGYYQVWASIAEDSKNDAVGADGSTGEDTAFGFQERRARFGAKGKFADGLVGYNYFTEWAGGKVSLLDYWLSLYPNDGAMEVRVGRFRPMVNYEGGMTSSFGLQGIERSEVGQTHSGYMTPFGSYRDLGVLVKFKTDVADFLVSVTNGLGNASDAQVGGDLRKKTVRSNKLFDAMYSLGVIAKPVPGLVVHASATMNKHDNAVAAIGDGGADTVVDIDRTAYSAGLKYKHDSGAWLDGEYMFGQRGGDDVHGEDELKGFFARVGYAIVPKVVNINARYGSIEKGKSSSTTDTQTGVAVNYWFSPKASATLEYETHNKDVGEDVNALRARAQVKF